ncbi:universal stress protein [Streptacidiphilus cavernicola]|uniref:Universal stress protein n=1 Tax=Streptacidiphilus cavernicola TaxID=3342716 RepID=A0ABV6W4R0_9ACTN
MARPRRGGEVFERGTDGPKVIVVGVDDSEASWRAVAYAVGLARRQGALLAMVHVRPVSAMAAVAGVSVVTAEPGTATAERICGRLRAGLASMTEVRSLRWEFHSVVGGDVVAALSQQADELKADAVVVGASHGLGHRFVGSAAVRLVRARRWPVTVVP